MVMSVSPTKKSDGIARSNVYGSWTGDGTAVTLTLGFNPSYLQIINSTDAIIYEKILGMAANACVKQVTAGTTTIDTTPLITFNGDGTVTLAAGLNVSAKAFAFIAQ
jgi:hypothetical protein